MEIEIRRLGPGRAEDFRTIRLAALEAAPEAFGATHADTAAQTSAWFADRLRATTVFGAYADERIVGMAGLKVEDGPKDRHKGRLWGVFVDPGVRGFGVGARLVEAVLAVAAEQVEQTTLAVVSTNAPAIALYARAGFACYGVEPRALKDAGGYADEMLMVRFHPRTG